MKPVVKKITHINKLIKNQQLWAKKCAAGHVTVLCGRWLDALISVRVKRITSLSRNLAGYRELN